MTKRTDISENEAIGSPDVTCTGIDLRLVELVRFMARCAAEHDYESLLEAAANKDDILSGKINLP